jgi:hypothetical protein
VTVATIRASAPWYGTLATHLGGVAKGAMIMASVYLIGLVVPWFVPKTAGKALPA